MADARTECPTHRQGGEIRRRSRLAGDQGGEDALSGRFRVGVARRGSSLSAELLDGVLPEPEARPPQRPCGDLNPCCGDLHLATIPAARWVHPPIAAREPGLHGSPGTVGGAGISEGPPAALSTLVCPPDPCPEAPGEGWIRDLSGGRHLPAGPGQDPLQAEGIPRHLPAGGRGLGGHPGRGVGGSDSGSRGRGSA